MILQRAIARITRDGLMHIINTGLLTRSRRVCAACAQRVAFPRARSRKTSRTMNGHTSKKKVLIIKTIPRLRAEMVCFAWWTRHFYLTRGCCPAHREYQTNQYNNVFCLPIAMTMIIIYMGHVDSELVSACDI